MGKLKNVIPRGIHALEFLTETSKYWLLLPFGWLKYHNKNAWLISERGTDARDNGYHFFRYMKEKHPEQKVYYILDKSSADYAKVADYGNIIQYRSLEHYMLYAGAEVKISTHDCGCAPDRWWYSKLEKRKMIPGKLVFLQHGITKDDMVMLHREQTGIDLFICGARPEYEYILNHFGYEKKQVKYTGFARYDNLAEFHTVRQILVMPTWRRELSGMTEKQVWGSEYVKKWLSFLHDESLSTALEENKVKLVFYPHYEMQKYLHMFNSKSPNIQIASFDSYDVQQLLKESALLVTDYSSVYFDFAYMQKPLIYYQFDRERYRKSHYKKGYFDYDTMGFGPVAFDENAAVREIMACIKGEFCVNKAYRKRVENFFVYHDRQNCERIYHEIEKLTKLQAEEIE